jgi:Flp pilus assembly protein TadG
MRKLDQRGVAAFEFILIFVPLFTLMFVIFDLGRYAITMQSLRTLASSGARAVMINCYSPAAVQKQSPSGCTGDPMPATTDKQNAAPFLFFGGLTPTLNVTSGGNNLTVTASQPGFTMLMTIWGAALNAPSASTNIPF